MFRKPISSSPCKSVRYKPRRKPFRFVCFRHTSTYYAYNRDLLVCTDHTRLLQLYNDFATASVVPQLDLSATRYRARRSYTRRSDLSNGFLFRPIITKYRAKHNCELAKTTNTMIVTPIRRAYVTVRLFAYEKMFWQFLIDKNRSFLFIYFVLVQYARDNRFRYLRAAGHDRRFRYFFFDRVVVTTERFSIARTVEPGSVYRIFGACSTHDRPVSCKRVGVHNRSLSPAPPNLWQKKKKKNNTIRIDWNFFINSPQ